MTKSWPKVIKVHTLSVRGSVRGTYLRVYGCDASVDCFNQGHLSYQPLGGWKRCNRLIRITMSKVIQS